MSESISGLTTKGIVRKRMPELYSDFATRIKECDAFGQITTADNPDLYASDPLVQIMSAASASDSDLWEAVEYLSNQFDPTTASGIYLDNLFGSITGIFRYPSESDESYQARILDAFSENKPLCDPEVLLQQHESVDCVRTIKSTPDCPIPGMASDEVMFAIRSCREIDYQALAQLLWENVDLNCRVPVGDTEVIHYYNDGAGCVKYKFQEACKVFVGVRITGYTTDKCFGTSDEFVLQQAITRLKTLSQKCDFGQSFASAEILRVLCDIPNFVVTDVLFFRRAKQMAWKIGTENAIMVEDCGEIIPWETTEICGNKRGEFWKESDPLFRCLKLRPWEYPDFDIQFGEIIRRDSACDSLNTEPLDELLDSIRQNPNSDGVIELAGHIARGCVIEDS